MIKNAKNVLNRFFICSLLFILPDKVLAVDGELTWSATDPGPVDPSSDHTRLDAFLRVIFVEKLLDMKTEKE